MPAFDQEYIIAYLQNELSAAERLRFEAALAEDPELQGELAIQQHLLQSIDLKGEALMKGRLANLLPKSQKKVTKISPKPNPVLRVVRMVIPLAGVLLLLFFILPKVLNPTADVDSLFSRHYKAYPLNFATRTNDPNTLLLNAANTAYQEKQYAAASQQLKQIVEQDQDGKYRLALGICALELKEDQAALQSFSLLISPPDPVYASQAMWYAALVHLRLEEIDKAEHYLQQLAADPQAYQHQKAKTLLRQSIFSK